MLTTFQCEMVLTDFMKFLVELNFFYYYISWKIHKRCKAVSGEKKAHGAKYKGNQSQTSKGLLPVESQRMGLILLAISCVRLCGVLSNQEAHQRLTAKVSVVFLVTQTFSVWHVPKFQTPRKKADIQHKHIVKTVQA